MDRLTQGEKLLGVSALWLYIISFIGFWAELEVEAPGTRSEISVSAWDGYGLEVRLALIVALVAVGLVALRALGASFDLPVAWGLIYTGIGGLTLLLMLLTALVGPDEARSWFAALSPPSGSRIEINRGVGLFIGTVFAAAMVAGGYQHLKTGDTTTRSATPSASPPASPTGA